MRFLFRLDLSLHAGAGKNLEFWILQLNKGLDLHIPSHAEKVHNKAGHLFGWMEKIKMRTVCTHL